MNINSGASYATSNNYVQNGTLVIGDINSNYGNGNNWNSNTAGLILECLDNTEIAIHDYGNRVVGAIQYLGNTTNQLIIGRDMGWGTISSIKLMEQ